MQGQMNYYPQVCHLLHLPLNKLLLRARERETQAPVQDLSKLMNKGNRFEYITSYLCVIYN